MIGCNGVATYRTIGVATVLQHTELIGVATVLQHTGQMGWCCNIRN